MAMRLTRLALLAASFALAAVTVPTAAIAGPDCLCRYQGTFYKQGQCVCMRFGGSERMACCNQVLNNTSWSFMAGSCKIALDGSKQRAGVTPVPKGIVERRLSQRQPAR